MNPTNKLSSGQGTQLLSLVRYSLNRQTLKPDTKRGLGETELVAEGVTDVVCEVDIL